MTRGQVKRRFERFDQQPCGAAGLEKFSAISTSPVLSGLG
jgi:hypothetical protein